MPLPTGTSLNTGLAVRDPVYVAGLGAVGCIRKTVQFSDGKAVEIPLGTLPANALISADGGAVVTTPFTAGTTLDIGVAGTPTVIAAALDVTTAGLKPATLSPAPAAADRTLVARLNNAGAVAAGVAEVIVTYIA